MAKTLAEVFKSRPDLKKSIYGTTNTSTLRTSTPDPIEAFKNRPTISIQEALSRKENFNQTAAQKGLPLATIPGQQQPKATPPETGGSIGGSTTYTPPQNNAMSFGQASNQASQQLDPLYQRALHNVMQQKYQNELNASEVAKNRGMAHSGLAADQLNKIAIASQGQVADMDAQRASQTAQMAQALVNRNEDRSDRLRQQAFQEWMGQQNLGLQRDQFDFNKDNQGWQNRFQYGQATGQFGNGQQTLASQQFDWNRALQEAGMTGNFNGERTLEGQQFDFGKAMQQAQFERAGQQFAQQMGLNWAQLDQRQKEFISNQAMKQQQFDADQSWKQKGFEADQASQTSESTQQLKLNDYIKGINQQFMTYNEMDQPAGINTQKARTYIIGLNLPDEQTDELLRYYGLPTN
jgi:hypothetical protein